MACRVAQPPCCGTHYDTFASLLALYITETNRIHLVLCGVQNGKFGPYLAAKHRRILWTWGQTSVNLTLNTPVMFVK
jgi:hypothetical protein